MMTLKMLGCKPSLFQDLYFRQTLGARKMTRVNQNLEYAVIINAGPNEPTPLHISNISQGETDKTNIGKQTNVSIGVVFDEHHWLCCQN